MSEGTMLLTNIPIKELFDNIRGIVQDEINRDQSTQLKEKLLSPKETCQLFEPNITKPTLAKWDKDGHIRSYRIGGRVFYKYSEVIDSAKSLKKYKKVLSRAI
jgi:hypothetical protein